MVLSGLAAGLAPAVAERDARADLARLADVLETLKAELEATNPGAAALEGWLSRRDAGAVHAFLLDARPRWVESLRAAGLPADESSLRLAFDETGAAFILGADVTRAAGESLLWAVPVGGGRPAPDPPDTRLGPLLMAHAWNLAALVGLALAAAAMLWIGPLVRGRRPTVP